MNLQQLKASAKEGFQTAADLMTAQLSRRHSVLDPEFNRLIRKGGTVPVMERVYDPELQKNIIRRTGEYHTVEPLQTPGQFLGAYTARLLTDVGEDATRQFYWRYNHPMALAEKVVEQFIPQIADIDDPTKRAAITLGISAPVAASMGTYDITNPAQMFRPKGYAQTYAEPGTDDHTETAQPAQELFERIFLGRRGKPLSYEEAKQEIPSLTPERYSNVLRSQYQDRGLLGLGLIKGTTQNIEGYPEVRVVGFPVGLQSAGALAGGIVAGRQAMRQSALPTRAKAGITLAGSLAGAVLGNLTNKVLASAQNNPEQLPSTYEYQQHL